VYLETLPKDSLIAAPPVLADYIPTFSRRKVFINGELSHPWPDKYWETVKARTFEFFDAYFSDRLDKVAAFCRKHEIDYLIIDRRHFTKEFLKEGKIYFEPFDSYVKAMTGNRDSFALEQIASGSKAFADGHIFVVRSNVLVQGKDNRRRSAGLRAGM
jgi:hypothetical protein